MTVKCLNSVDKSAIVFAFTQTTHTDFDSLASNFGVSRRTIIRVIEEAGVDPKIRRRKRNSVNIHVTEGGLIVEQFPLPLGEPWFKRKQGLFNRIIAKVTRAIAFR